MNLHCNPCNKQVTPVIIDKGHHLTAYCPVCDKYLKHVGAGSKKTGKAVQPELKIGGRYTLPEFEFGMYLGIPIYEFNTVHMLRYIKWAKHNNKVWKRLNKITQFAITEKLKEHDH